MGLFRLLIHTVSYRANNVLAFSEFYRVYHYVVAERRIS